MSTIKKRRQKFGIVKVGGQKKGDKRGAMSEEQRIKISEAKKGGRLSEEHKRNISKSHTGIKRGAHTEDTRQKISATKQGIDIKNWNGFISYEPYCPRFNYKRKEEIRNKCNRVCVVSGVSALQNGRRLDVDHIDENKMQGCNGIKWKLVPLARNIHAKMQKSQNHLLLELLLIKNGRAQINYEEGN